MYANNQIPKVCLSSLQGEKVRLWLIISKEVWNVTTMDRVFYVATQLNADGAWDDMKSRQRNRLSGWRHCDDAQSYSVGFLEVMVKHGQGWL